MKKIGKNREMEESRSERTKEKGGGKCNKDPASSKKEKKKRKRKKQREKKKDWKERNLWRYEYTFTHPQHSKIKKKLFDYGNFKM